MQRGALLLICIAFFMPLQGDYQIRVKNQTAMSIMAALIGLSGNVVGYGTLSPWSSETISVDVAIVGITVLNHSFKGHGRGDATYTISQDLNVTFRYGLH